MQQRFGDRFNKALAVAREEAHRRGSEAVTPIHLLLSVLRSDSASEGAQEILVALGKSPDVLFDEVSSHLQGRAEGHSNEIPEEDSEAVDVLFTEAALEAEKADVATIGPEHVLLALLKFPLTSELMEKYGVEHGEAWAAYEKLLVDPGRPRR